MAESSKIQFILLLVVAVLFGITKALFETETCHIPAGQSISAEAGKDSVRFTFSQIENNQNALLELPNLSVASHQFTIIDGCTPFIFVLSEPVEKPNLLLTAYKIDGITFGCVELTNNSVDSVIGTVEKFIREPDKYDERIPSSWRSGYNIIFKLNIFRGLPIKKQAAYKCKLEKIVDVFNDKLNITVTTSFSLQKVGCPKNRWGTNCGSSCLCQNGGECRTFKGSCLCLEGTSGLFCDKREPGFVPPTTTVAPDTSSTQDDSTTETGRGTDRTSDTSGSLGSTVTSTSKLASTSNANITTRTLPGMDFVSSTKWTVPENDGPTIQGKPISSDGPAVSRTSILGKTTPLASENVTSPVTGPTPHQSMSSEDQTTVSLPTSFTEDKTTHTEVWSTGQTTSPRSNRSNTSSQQSTLHAVVVTPAPLILLSMTLITFLLTSF